MKEKKRYYLSSSGSNYLLVYCCVIVILALSLFNIFLYLAIPTNSILGNNTEANLENKLTKEKTFWINFLEKNPGYFQGWIELTKINLKLDKPDEARGTFQKAREINPNSDAISELDASFR
jgi:cytochrome c-type biogenesis protein CcmH/NrfG